MKSIKKYYKIVHKKETGEESKIVKSECSELTGFPELYVVQCAWASGYLMWRFCSVQSFVEKYDVVLINVP